MQTAAVSFSARDGSEAPPPLPEYLEVNKEGGLSKDSKGHTAQGEVGHFLLGWQRSIFRFLSSPAYFRSEKM